MEIPRHGNERCLEHDSYVQLDIIEFDDTLIEEAIRSPENFLGPIANDDIRRLINDVKAAPSLTPEKKNIICGNLRRVLNH